MTTPEKLLQCLLSGHATTTDLAAAVHVPALTVRAMLRRHETELRVTSQPWGDDTRWALTRAGLTQANALKDSILI